MRRKYLIRPKFQISFIIYFVGLALMAAILAHLSILVFVHKFKIMGQELGIDTQTAINTFIEQEKYALALWFVASISISISTIVVSGILLSHRVAGPLSRLARYLKDFDVTKEDNPPLSFRKGDYFQDIPRIFNYAFKSKIKFPPHKKFIEKTHPQQKAS